MTNEKVIKEKYDELFKDFDKDGNGSISKEEMFEFLKELSGFTGEIDFDKVIKFNEVRASIKQSKKKET